MNFWVDILYGVPSPQVIQKLSGSEAVNDRTQLPQ
jgi:hypothetical protein